MEIILSTRNKSKMEQIKAALNGTNLTVLSLNEAGIIGEAVEDGITLEENAFKKASFANKNTGRWAIADDTGLFIDALDGRPGIYAARWAGDGKTAEEVRDFTLEQLRDVPLSKRTAVFRTVAVVVSPEGKQYSFLGEVKGVLLESPRTECQPNMPYSGLFVPEGQDKVWAEMGVEEENRISHRGQAFRQVKEFFERLKWS